MDKFAEGLAAAIEGYSPTSFIGRFIIFFYCLLNYPPLLISSFVREILPFTWYVIDDSDFWVLGRRLYIRLKGDDAYQKPAIRLSIWTPPSSFGFDLHHGGEDAEIGFSVSIAGLAVSAAIENALPNNYNCEAYRFGISCHHHGLWFSWNLSNDGSPFCFSYLDFFLGSRDYCSRKIICSLDPVTIPGDSSMYPARIDIYKDTWKRPRWPFTEVVYRAHCEFSGGIPSGYKWGEPDATFGSTFPADTIGSAVKYIQESVLRDRAKEGWEPLKLPITELIDLQVS